MSGTEVVPYNNISKGQPEVDELKGVKQNGEGWSGRYYMFTDWDPQNFDPARIKNITKMVYQLEKGEEKKGLHIQGVVRFKNSVKWSTAVKRITGIVPCDVRGIPAKDIARVENYCKKKRTRVDGPWIIGEETHQGARNDLAGLWEAIKEGKSSYALFEDFTELSFKYGRGIKEARAAFNEEKSYEFRNIEVVLCIGTTGIGKTKSALYCDDLTRDRTTFRITAPPQDGRGNWGQVWFDGYNRQETIVLDDFTGWIPLEDFLTLTDGHQYRASIKGGFTYLLHKRVICTSNIPAAEWWKNIKEGQWDAFIRRVKRIVVDGTIVK